jgi:hypothetical protein
MILIASTQAAKAESCPEGVDSQLNDLYAWHVAAPDRDTFLSQQQRFTPFLYGRISRAFDLSPARDGRFVDLDIFSGTQVATFGADVLACYPSGGSTVDVIVAVRTGLRGQESDVPQILRYRMIKDSTDNWRISNIVWDAIHSESHSLNRFLDRLLP